MSKLSRILILLGLTGMFATSQVQRSGSEKPALVLGNPGSAIGSVDELKQYTAGGHILGFRKGEMFVASGDHALRMEYVNARGVSPQKETPTEQIYPVLSWNTFLGGAGLDRVRAIALDKNGNIYVAGYNSGNAFVAKLNDSGVLQWNTFLGGSGFDAAYAIDVDIAGNIFVAGRSSATWGLPIRPYTANDNAFVAKLDNSGVLQWNTFLGESVGAAAWNYSNYAIAIDVDIAGNIFVAGQSSTTWGSPIRPYAGNEDAFLAKLDNSGVLQWNTFLGGSELDYSSGIAVDVNGNIYVVGQSLINWGTPKRSYSEDSDAFVAKLNSSGFLQWNTFLGGSDWDYGNGIAVGSNGNIFITGMSLRTWGSPIIPFPLYVSRNAFVAKLDNSGVLQWNTFLGGKSFANGNGISVDNNEYVYVVGSCNGTWGSSIRPFTPASDAFVARLNQTGALAWNIFLGGSAGGSVIQAGVDEGYAIALGTSGNIYVAGSSMGTWGSPIRPYSGNEAAFVAKLTDLAIEVTSPNGGEIWPGGYIQNITWTTIGMEGNVKIEYSTNGGTTYIPIIAATPNIGSYLWAVPYTASANCLVKVSEATSGTPFDVSDAVFTMLSVVPVPTVTTTAATNITSTAAVSGGNVTSDGGAAVTARGVCISTSANPTISNNHTHDGSGLGSFTTNLTSATPGTTYYVRAYATNSWGTAYGEDSAFTTLPALWMPTVTTMATTSVTNTSAVSGGNVLADNMAAVTDRGVCISTSANPTISNARTHNGSGIGSFSSSLTNATPGTTYHIRAYATNSMGTAYGNDVWFKTSGGAKNDFNGDGYEDILWRNLSTGENYLWFLGPAGAASAGLSTKDAGTLFSGAALPEDYRAVQGFFEGKPAKSYRTPQEGMNLLDQKGTSPSPVIASEGRVSTGQWQNPNASFAGVTIQSLTRMGGVAVPSMIDFNWKIVGTGDFNGDGRPDIVWRNSANGDNGVWYMDGGTQLGAEYLLSVTDMTWEIVGTGDFNGDPKLPIEKD